MDNIITSLFSKLPPSGQTGLLVFLGLSCLSAHIVSNTPTPPPGTLYSKLYRVLELLAGIYNLAKQEGMKLPEVASQAEKTQEGGELKSGLTKE